MDKENKMITYIEATETPEPEEELNFIRVDLADYKGTEEECISEVKALMSSSCENFILQKHYCTHEDAPPYTSCTIEEVK